MTTGKNHLNNTTNSKIMPLDKAKNHIQGNRTNQPYLISFEHYKWKKCEIKDISKSGTLKKALEWFRDVGAATEIGEIPGSYNVKNFGEYSFLFDRLDEDVEIKEYKLDRTDGRIFFYADDAKKIIHCILIKNAHIEI
jgi:hypothetical protein